jgi:peptide/nickel transport system substrate-binding protein
MILCGCRKRAVWDGSEVVLVIESNPVNLDARYGQDAQSQRIAALIYSGLVERDAKMNLHGDLAESWETPDVLTYIFLLKKGVKFHDGREVTSKDVKATIEYMMNPANKSPKGGSFRMIASIEAPDAGTVSFEGAVRVVSVEPGEVSGGNCAGGCGKRFFETSSGKRAVSICEPKAG